MIGVECKLNNIHKSSYPDTDGTLDPCHLPRPAHTTLCTTTQLGRPRGGCEGHKCIQFNNVNDECECAC